MDAPAGIFFRLRLLALTATLSAVRVWADNNAWLVTGWQVADGIPNNNVAGITQTADGHLWLALPDAVARFDGVRFERFSPEDIGVPSGHRIRAVLRGRDDALWVAIDHIGVLRLKEGARQAFAGEVAPRLDSLFEDAEGAVWASYNSGEVLRVAHGSAAAEFKTRELPSSSRGAFALDADGRLWCARGAAIGYFRDGRFVSVWRAPASTTRLASSSLGGVWVSCGFKLFQVDDTGRARDCGTLQPATIAGEISVLLEDRNGGLWIGTTTSGLVRYDGLHFENVGVSDREVRALFEDREGNIWVGTAGGGLNRVREHGVTLEVLAANPSQDSIQSIAEDSTGHLWAATSNGRLARRTADGWQTITTGEAGRIAQATCVACAPDGTVWIGTAVRELHAWREGKLTTYAVADGLAGHTARALCAARNGDVWIAQDGPSVLQRWRQGKLTTPNVPGSVTHIRALVEDGAGEIWIGAERAALLRVRDDEVIDESHRITETTKTIRSLCLDEKGALWIGFGGDGVGCLRDGRFALIRSDQGLYEENISQILSDGRGWLWFGCDRGLFKVRLQELVKVADGAATMVQSVFYGRDQGLPPLQAAYGNWPSGVRTRDGRLWIPMRSAVAAVHPARLRDDTLPVPVLLKRMEADDAVIASYDGPLPVASRVPAGRIGLHRAPVAVPIAPTTRRLTFEYTALSMRAPDSVQFRHRIVGFDSTWSSATAERRATYPRLDAGAYRFEVIARNPDGIWNKAGPAIAFTVAPFVWQTWWFRLLVLAAFTFAVAAVVRYVSFRRLQASLRALREQAALDKERARIARDIHDDVGGRLTRIVLLTGLALRERRDPEKSNQRVTEIANSARQVIKSLDETVWAINPRNDTLPDLINYLGQFAIEFMRTADVPCQVDLPDHPPARRMSAEARHHLFLAVKEALNNIVRHAGRCEVRLAITHDDSALRIVVADNGAGFADRPADAGADGLRNMQQRLADIGGTCAVESAPGKGTRLTFVYPWPAVAKGRPAMSDRGAP